MLTSRFVEYAGGAIRTVRVNPWSPEARGLRWTCLGDERVLEVGEHGGRWELVRTVDDVGFLTDVVRSAMAGRVREVIGYRRSRVEGTLADGSVAVETGYQPLWPIRGWRRRGKVIQYRPY